MERELIHLSRGQFYNLCTGEDGRTVDCGHTGEVVRVTDEMAVCGDDKVAFAYRVDTLYKVKYLKPMDKKTFRDFIPIEELLDEDSEPDSTYTRSFTIDDELELRYYNKLMEYVSKHGTVFHGMLVEAFDDTPAYKRKFTPEEIDAASDEALGIYFNDTTGMALGSDLDEDFRNKRRLKLKIRCLKELGCVDVKDMSNNKTIYFGFDSNDEETELIHRLQRLTRGFDDSETWNLDSTIAKFIVPRLEVFIEENGGYPMGKTPEQWDEELRSMLWSFKYFCIADWVFDRKTLEPVMPYDEWDEVDRKKLSSYYGLSKRARASLDRKHKRGIKLFCENFEALWW